MTRHVYPFDLILLCPLRLPEGTTDDAVERALEKGKWTRVNDLLRRGMAKEDDGFAYAELAYFHFFVQRFLYGNSATDTKTPLRLYRLSEGAERIEVDDDWVDQYRVNNVWLYVAAKYGLAVLVLDLSAEGPTTWDKASDAICYLRTIYFQHYKKDPKSGEWRGGGAPVGVRVVPAQAESMKDLKRESDGRGTLTTVLDRRTFEFLPHWRNLLAELSDGKIEVTSLGDHRMAAMAFLGTPEPFGISDDEWLKLSEADGSQFKVYAPDFRRESLAKATYDRWWNPDTRSRTQDHRYLAGPMTFLSVKREPSSLPPADFARLRTTWRRQQFQLFFLAHFQRAALIVLQDRIAKVTQSLRNPGSHTEPLREIKGIQRDMAEFSSGAWFTEVSPQVQGQELYQLLSRQLGLESHYRSVMADKSLLGNWADANFQYTINLVAIPAGIVLGFLGINVLIDPIKGLIEPWLSASTWGIEPWCCGSTEINRMVVGFIRDGSIAAVVVAAAWFGWRWYRSRSFTKQP